MNLRFILYICFCFVTLFANAQNIQELRKKANDAKQNGDVREAVTLYTEIIEQLDFSNICKLIVKD